MAEISAQLVKELREMTGAGMMECKKALTETEGELEKAVDVLRTRGLAVAAKKAGRATNEGLIIAKLADDAKSATLVEVNCETDFVARNDVFAALAEKIAAVTLASKPADLEALNALDLGGETVADAITDAIHTIGENMQVGRFTCLTADKGAFSSYVHGGGRLGILVQFSFDKPETADAEAFKTASKDIAMQVAAANPLAISQESFDPAVIEKEMSIYKAQAAESGKPENIQENIATGRMKKFFAENALIEQAFIKNPDLSVGDVLAAASKELGDTITVVSFKRFGLGEL
jgi:elongation factor Ts